MVVLLAALSIRRIWAVDYWWQWKTGQYVAQQGIPRTAILSYTNPDHPRIELRWGYCLALYALSEWFGRGSAVVVKCVLVLAMFGVGALLAGARKSPVTTCVIVVIAALAAYQRFFVRPELISYLLLIAFVAIIERCRRRRTRWIAALPLLQIVWVNCHGLFLIGPAVVAIWLVSEGAGRVLERAGRQTTESDRRRRLRTAGALLALVCAASLVNPYFHRAVLLPVLQFAVLHGTAQKDFFVELRSTFDSRFAPYTALSYYKMLIGVVAMSVLLNPRRQQLFWVLLVGSQFYLSVTAIRNLPLFCLIAVPFVVRNIRESAVRDWRPMARCLPAGRVVATAAVVAFCLFQARELYTNRFAIRQGDTNQFGVGLATNRYPVGAVEFLRAAGVQGPIFHPPGPGSYMLAHDIPVFIDPRGEVYMDGIIDEFQTILDHPDRLPQYVSKYGFRAILMQTGQYGTILAFCRQPGWRMVYADSEAVVLFRSDTAPHVPELVLSRDADRWFTRIRRALPPPVRYADSGWFTQLSSPAPYMRLARLCARFGAYRPVRVLLEDALAAYPPLFTAYGSLADAASADGDFAAAAGYYAEAVKRSPDDLDLRVRAAFACVQSGFLPAARSHLLAVLAISPDDPEAVALMGLVELRSQRYREAAERLGHAVELKPDRAAYYRRLAEAQIALGQVDAAVASLEAAFRIDPTDASAAEELARLLHAQGKPAAARRVVEEALFYSPDDPKLLELQRLRGR